MDDGGGLPPTFDEWERAELPAPESREAPSSELRATRLLRRTEAHIIGPALAAPIYRNLQGFVRHGTVLGKSAGTGAEKAPPELLPPAQRKGPA